MYIVIFSLAWLATIGLAATAALLEYWTAGPEDSLQLVLGNLEEPIYGYTSPTLH
jgi:hypothetical protein